MLNEKIYIPYHKHTSLSNTFVKDSVLQPIDYWNEFKKRYGGKRVAYCTTEHYWQSNYFQIYDDLEKYNKKNSTNIKFVFGVEAGFVKDRFSQDRAGHMILLAMNENGRRKINKALSIANKTGFYYNPRLDMELMLSLPKDDVFVTSACISTWSKYDWDDVDKMMLRLYKHFTNFYLEIQPHNTPQQIKLNKHLLCLHETYGIPLIAGTDTHAITQQQIEDRDYYLKSSGFSYEDEEGWDLDYPTYNVLYERFKSQEIFTHEQIIKSIENTNKILDFEDIKLDRSLKVPVLKKYRHLSQEERNETFRKILRMEWRQQEYDINPLKRQQYMDEICHDIDEIIGCNMADYFMFNYEVMKLGQEKYGGILTPSGRGSGVSMFLNKLLRFTKVDKVNSPVLMYSERFLTKERILESHQAPDIDHNVSDREPFLQAQRELLGELGTYDLLALGKLKYKSAFKMFARANDLDPQVANDVTKQISKYEDALRYKEEDEKIDIYDYVNEEKYGHLIEGCQHYLGIVESRKGHPCGALAYSGDIEEEVGIMLCKSETTGKEVFVALIESGTIDSFAFLKQDYLVVDSIGLTYDIYKEAGIEPLSVNELLDKIDGNDKVWDIYSNGETMCINQVEQYKTTQKVMKYKPRNISELSQFIAGVRPGFKSLYHKFESREKFEYGIKAFDDLIQDEYCNSSWVLYQEHLMKVLGFAGFPMSETYNIIKAISKKKDYVIKEAKPKFIKNMAQAILDTKETNDYDLALEMAENVWKVMEDSSAYSFNSAHSYSMSVDSVTLAYLKAYYPLEFYKVALQRFTQKGDKDKVTLLKKEMSKKGIKLKSARFGDDNRTFSIDYENNCINQTMSSIKGMSKITPNVLYELGQKKFDNALDLFVELDLSPLKKNDTLYMIKLNYYEEFGGVNYLINLWEQFNGRYKKTHVEKTKEKRLEELREYASSLNVETTQRDLLKYEVEILGYTDLIDESFDDMVYVFETIETNQYGTPFVMTYRVCDGERQQVKINRNYYNQNKVDKACLVKTVIKEQPKKIKNDEGKWANSKELEKIIDVYCVL